MCDFVGQGFKTPHLHQNKRYFCYLKCTPISTIIIYINYLYIYMNKNYLIVFCLFAIISLLYLLFNDTNNSRKLSQEENLTNVESDNYLLNKNINEEVKNISFEEVKEKALLYNYLIPDTFSILSEEKSCYSSQNSCLLRMYIINKSNYKYVMPIELEIIDNLEDFHIYGQTNDVSFDKELEKFALNEAFENKKTFLTEDDYFKSFGKSVFKVNLGNSQTYLNYYLYPNTEYSKLMILILPEISKINCDIYDKVEEILDCYNFISDNNLEEEINGIGWIPELFYNELYSNYIDIILSFEWK